MLLWFVMAIGLATTMMNGKDNNGSHGLDKLDFKVSILFDNCLIVDFQTVILPDSSGGGVDFIHMIF
jgi:hypothetical protein